MHTLATFISTKKSEGNEMAHLVITIGCEYGAKGNQIGKKVAKDLGIKFYDRDTVDEIIKEVGIPKDIMEKVEEGITIAGKVQRVMSEALSPNMQTSQSVQFTSRKP